MKVLRWVVLLAVALTMVASVSAQDELSGELTVSFWGNVDEYEQGLSDNRPWEATYNLIKQWDEMHENVTVTFISQPVDGIYDRVRTQLISNTLPDVVAVYPANLFLEGNLDLVYNLTSHMAEPNPYGEFETWGDEFWYDQSIGLRDTAIPPGEVYFVGNSLPTNIGQLVMYFSAGGSRSRRAPADVWRTAGCLRRAE